MGRPRVQEPEKHCAECGELMTRKTFNGRLEDLGVFNRRKYCNQTCMANAFVSDAPCEGTLHQRARKLRGTFCEFCGAMTRLQAHHKDWNVQNNSPENIQTLCISCHASYHHRVRRAGVTVLGR
jgi:hypothetical protein